MELARQLKTARLKAELTQRQLAKKLGYSTPQFVSNWERGVCPPPRAKLLDISNSLDLAVEDVFEAWSKEQLKKLRHINRV